MDEGFVAFNQKLKMIFLADYLKNETNKSHPKSGKQIEEYLKSNGINVKRRTLCEDINCLIDHGMHIEKPNSKKGGYYCTDRDFSISELKLLADSVVSSKFITEDKSRDLISKLLTLTNVYDAKKLRNNNQLIVQGRAKQSRRDVLSNVEKLSDAIADGRKITFRYYSYNIYMEFTAKHDGSIYTVSPSCLVYDNEYYYLVGYHHETGRRINFRVDRMKDIAISKEKRDINYVLSKEEIASYGQKIFNMYGGEEKKVEMRFDADLMGTAIDKFGDGIMPARAEDGRSFTLRVPVNVSPQFYAWVFGLGSKCEILSPPEVRGEMVKYAENLIERYKNKD